MKICFWANSMFKIGGEQKVTAIVANKLCSLGYDVTIIVKNQENINNNIYNLSKKIHIIFLENNYVFHLNTNKFINFLRQMNRKTGIFKNNKKILKRFLCSKKLEEQILKIFNKEKFDYIIGVGGDRSFILASLKDKINSQIIGWNQMDIESHFLNKNCRYQNELNLIVPLFKQFKSFIVLTEDDQLLLKRNFNVESIVIYNSYCKEEINI